MSLIDKIDKIIRDYFLIDCHTNVYGLSRSILALSTFLTFLVNDVDVLFRPYAGGEEMCPICSPMNKLSLFCMFPLEIGRYLSLIILFLVIIGFIPRLTGVLHFWVTSSFMTSSLLVDGGDQFASVLALLFIPLTLTDNRTNHWIKKSYIERISSNRQVQNMIGNFALYAIQIQMAIIYFEACVGKFKNNEWTNGTALYYWFNHPTFGLPQSLSFVYDPILANPFIIVLSTWGVLVIEGILFMAISFNQSMKLRCLKLGIIFHIMIFLIHGLPTFCLSMIAGLILYLGMNKNIDLPKLTFSKIPFFVLLFLSFYSNSFAQRSNDSLWINKEVKFINTEDSTILSGTLTSPIDIKKRKVGILLISGSGPQDRDETIMGKKPFKVIAEYLTQQGYFVLRYDDRGFGKSTGSKYPFHTTQQLSYDALGGINYLRDSLKMDKIGVLGHSEGGIIAGMLGAKSSKVLDFVITLASPCIAIDSLMTMQNRAIYKSQKIDSLSIEAYLQGFYKPVMREIILNKKDSPLIIIKNQLINFKALNPNILEKFIGKTKDSVFVSIFANQVNNPWFKYFIATQPSDYWQKVKIPILALQGTKDIQVLPENLKCLEKTVYKNRKSKFVALENHNHLFQKAVTGTINEYITLKETISDETLFVISNWLKLIK